MAEAFGHGGRVYSKRAGGASGSSTPSTSHTPFRQAGRPGGAFSIVEGKSRASREGMNRVDGKGKGKGGEGGKVWDLPRSAEVERLEGLRDKLRIVQDGGKVGREDGGVDCFCQGMGFALPRSQMAPWPQMAPDGSMAPDGYPTVCKTLTNNSQDTSPLAIHTSMPALRPRALRLATGLPPLSKLSTRALLVRPALPTRPPRLIRH